MPISPDSPTITWHKYLIRPLLPCRYVYSDNPKLTPDALDVPLEATHKSSASAMFARDTTIETTGRIIDRYITRLDKFLEDEKKEMMVEPDYTQTLYSEQAVAEVYFKNVLVPVKQALQELFNPALQREDLVGAKYFFNIRPQQMSSTGDRSRCDHYLVLEHMDGVIPDRATHGPPKQVEWQKPEAFMAMLEARQKWEKTNAADKRNEIAPEYPRVLCVIEEKKPHVIDPGAFTAAYCETSTLKRSQAARNVKSILPQIKKYSVDAECNLILLTDYINTMILEVKEAGAELRTRDDPRFPGFKDNRKEPIVGVERLKDKPPRYLLFMAAAKRLNDVKLISVTADSRLNFPPP
ncbi:hypothetical protein C8R47DRAFT_1258216 [Mycena vitilis]|nr:hypothetical protein C8R47DRAFT_1258216 [Mycena vitilis]